MLEQLSQFRNYGHLMRVAMEPGEDDLANWLDQVTADEPTDSGLLSEIEQLRRCEGDTDDRRLDLARPSA